VSYFRPGQTASQIQAIYDAWRKTLPWTDEEFAVACEEEAAQVEATNAYMARRFRYLAGRARLGRISRVILQLTMGRLIKSCFCGRKALYRTGQEGRCSEHRHIPSGAAATRKARLEGKASVINRKRVVRDTKSLAHMRLLETARRQNGRGAKR
jgi:hypothetical protein